ncbi:MAG: deoxyguanosinetriphosphate triphosphohydrolase [Anaerolineales bacterium]|nr:deoxyguanosinetriphosphate triphosphohydrolase [Anaerolineales bacterium]
MQARAEIEQHEDQILAPYALRSRDSRGRAFPSDEHAYRTCFQRDRDRVLHTTAFRRLEYKTQVFIFAEGDYYRTRLTHTLEVAQIGRTIARALGANEDLVEAICLAHDLGHPPFGHAGESALADLMAEHGGFNHNRHSVRIVTHLERRFPEFPGLNLTWEVREGMVKHETEYDVADASDYEPEKRAGLEAQICNAADELAYSAHDLDDGLRSGLISAPQLAGVALWDDLVSDLGIPASPLEDLARHRLIRRLINLQVTDLLATTSKAIADSCLASADDVQRLDHNLVAFSPPLAEKNRQLKTFLFHNLYQHYRVYRMQVKAERIVSDLFTAYASKPEVLPGEVRDRTPQEGLHRTISDYIAGMTDRFALQEHGRLFDPLILP